MKICKYCGTKSEDTVTLCGACGANEFMPICSNCGTKSNGSNFCPNCGVKFGTVAKKCPTCGTEYFSNACPNCGYTPAKESQIQIPFQQPQININAFAAPVNKKNKWVALILCIFFGFFGAHKFYEGKTGLGVLYLFTAGLFGIGWIVDILALLSKPTTYTV